MAYHFYLAGTELPVTPGALSIKIANNNKTVTLIDQGDINILKSPGLSEISFDALLPSQQYPFSNYESFVQPSFFLDILEYYKTEKEPLQFVVTRPLEDGRNLHNTSMRVSVEDYEEKEDAGQYGTDVLVSIKLKMYRDFGTKTVAIKANIGKTAKKRAQDNKPKAGQTYKVKRNDNLISIAKHFYNDSSKWETIYNANKSVIGSRPALIKPGQELNIPKEAA